VDAALRLRARRRGIVQVIMNLIQNAKDAAGPDGQFGIRCREERNAGSGEDWFVFSVWDTGPGIPQEVQERMFSPFFTTKRVGHGTGLGLSIVLGLVDQWGGRVEVKSAIGDGTVFDIYLKRLA
jgi:signal transduction histidine kinase